MTTNVLHLELRLRYSSEQQRAACGLLVAGTTPTRWLAAIEKLAVTREFHELFAQLKFLPIPTSRSQLTPQAALILLPNAEVFAAAAALLPAGPLFGRLGTKLLLPVEAVVTLPVSGEEFAALLDATTALALWHPQLGLLRFEPEDILTCGELLALPTPTHNDWSLAVPGLALNVRLFEVQVEGPQDAEQVMQAAADGIGSQTGQSSATAVASTFGQQAMQAGQTLGNFVAAPLALLWMKLASLGQGQSSRPSQAAGGKSSARPEWANKLDDWARQALQSSLALLNARQREMQRLMNLLRDNPDEGLKYAIPFSSQRPTLPGIGPPTFRLFPRLVDFNLSSLFGSGSGAVDCWDMPQQSRWELHRRYHELATRELQLGRHRRAAYIFGELLGEYKFAAAALEEGGFYREAAILYRDRLHAPRDAAECLERGGLLHEAIPLYAQLQQFEKVGDLHRLLDDESAAEAAFLQAVDRSLDLRQPHTAARIQLEKLNDTPAALATLDQGWRNGQQTLPCLQQSFQIFAKSGMHTAASELVADLQQTKFRFEEQQPVLTALVETFENYPQASVREASAGAVRVLMSQALKRNPEQAQSQLPMLHKLAPHDRLLGRDLQRQHDYIAIRSKQLKSTRSQTRKSGWRAEPRAAAHLGWDHVAWQTGLEADGLWVVTGIRRAGNEVQRILSTAKINHEAPLNWSSHSWPLHPSVDLPAFAEAGLSFLAAAEAGLERIVDHPLQMAFNTTRMRIHLIEPGNDYAECDIQVPGALTTLRAGTPSFIEEWTTNIACDSSITWGVEWPTQVLRKFDARGKILASLPFEFDPSLLSGSPNLIYGPRFGKPFLACAGRQFLAVENALLEFHDGKLQQMHIFEEEIRDLRVLSSPHSEITLAVLFARGGCIGWPQRMNIGLAQRFESHLAQPHAAFLKGELLLLAEGEVWEIVQPFPYQPHRVERVTGFEHTPALILPHPRTRHCVVITHKGEAVTYELLR